MTRPGWIARVWPWVADALRTLAPVPLSAGAAGLVLVLWRGGWPVETAEARIQWLGIALIGVIGLLGLALFLARGGIRTLSLRAGPVEASINEPGSSASGELPDPIDTQEGTAR